MMSKDLLQLELKNDRSFQAIDEIAERVSSLEQNVERIQVLRQELTGLEQKLSERKVVLLQGHILSSVGDGRYRISLTTGERAYLNAAREFGKGDGFSLNAVAEAFESAPTGNSRVFREATPDDHLYQSGLQEHFLEIKARLSRLESEIFGIPMKVN